ISSAGNLGLEAGVFNASDSAGVGGTLNVTGTTVTIDGGSIDVAPDGGNDAGGQVSITGTTSVSITGTINASGQGSGNGGSVTISTPVSIDLSLMTINAAGGPTSNTGGSVTVNHAFGPSATSPWSTRLLDINQYVTVDGGSSTASSTGNDGKITLNGIPCQQRASGFSDFPKSYFNCAHPTGTATAEDVIPEVIGNGLGSLRSTLSGTNTNIFVFSNPEDEATFFTDEDLPSSTGSTFKVPETSANPIGVAVMEGCTDCAGHSGSYSLSDQELNETSAHELGHALDYGFAGGGDLTESDNATYVNYVRRDNLHLDFISIGVDEASSIRRLPCAATPDPAHPGTNFPDLPPFVGVNVFPDRDLAPVAMCVSGALNTGSTALGHIGFPPAGTRNSTLLQNYSGRTEVHRELYAQSFAYKAAANSSDYADPPADGVFSINYLTGTPYFACTVGRATQITSGSGAIPADCTSAGDAWYVLILP
ncbi:MAG: hypothetical protein ACRD3W_05725, partial [Terriglobales bacterium]